MDWKKIKREYIAGGTSYRKLCEKYGVKLSTLRGIAIKEGWVKLREQTRHKTDTKLTDEISDRQAKQYKRLQDVTDKLLGNLESIVENVTLNEMMLDKYTLKQITGALKDIKDIQALKSPLDIREQCARIAKLEKEANESNDAPADITIKIEGGEEAWQK